MISSSDNKILSRFIYESNIFRFDQQKSEFYFNSHATFENDPTLCTPYRCTGGSLLGEATRNLRGTGRSHPYLCILIPMAIQLLLHFFLTLAVLLNLFIPIKGVGR